MGWPKKGNKVKFRAELAEFLGGTVGSESSIVAAVAQVTSVAQVQSLALELLQKKKKKFILFIGGCGQKPKIQRQCCFVDIIV